MQSSTHTVDMAAATFEQEIVHTLLNDVSSLEAVCPSPANRPTVSIDNLILVTLPVLPQSEIDKLRMRPQHS